MGILLNQDSSPLIRIDSVVDEAGEAEPTINKLNADK